MIYFGDQKIRNNVKTRSNSFLPRLSKKHNVETDSRASSGGQGKYMKWVRFPWPPLGAALSIFNVSFFVKNTFQNELIKTKETPRSIRG
jgi:hypothetical protein